MKRDEKNMLTRRKILDGAFREFGEKSFGDASLNAICSDALLSKGIIYHYFKDKDELYLACVKECFDALTEFLGALAQMDALPIEQALSRYFDARTAFFAEHPLYLGIFCSAVMNPPVHLSPAIKESTAGFDVQTISILTALVQTVKLRPDVTTEEVVEIFREYQDFVNARFQMKASGASALREHELRCRRSLQVLLYGVVEREA